MYGIKYIKLKCELYWILSITSHYYSRLIYIILKRIIKPKGKISSNHKIWAKQSYHESLGDFLGSKMSLSAVEFICNSATVFDGVEDR